jgi:membrane-associated phospholipid phosphatase
VQRGTWGDLDVSDQRQRNQFYAILLPLLLIIALLSWRAEVPRAIPLGAVSIIALVGTAFLLNAWVKVSLHTGFAVFAAETFFFFRPTLGGAVLFLAILVGWSRVALGRHTVPEVLLGGILGASIGAALVISLNVFA